MEITNVHKTFGILFFESSDFCTGIIHHEVRRIPRWVPSLDYGKCFTYRGLIFGLAHEFSYNLSSHVGMYTNEKKWKRTLSFCTWCPSGPVHYHIFQTFVVAMALDVQRGRFPQQFQVLVHLFR